MVTWRELKRLALFEIVQLSAPQQGRGLTWTGGYAEREADDFLQHLHGQFRLKEWIWPLETLARLEDNTLLECTLELDARRPPARLRELLALYCTRKALDHRTPRQETPEWVRITELLEGRSFPT